MSEWRCSEGHRTREPGDNDLLLPCGCVFDPNDLNSLAVAIFKGVDIPGAVDHWRELKGRPGPFTWEDVDLLDSLISFAPGAEFGPHVDRLRSFRGRIAALLPPREP